MSKVKKPTTVDLSAVLSKNVVVRMVRGQVVVSAVTIPRESKSEKKQKTKDKFRSAGTWAKWILTQPGMEELYATGIDEDKTNAYTVALTDYMTAPEIHYVSLKEYKGAAGDKVRIKVTDDFQVTSVNVSIMNNKGKLLEAGAAVRYGRKPANWVYITTVANPGLEGTTQVTAEDRPRNRVVQEVRIEGHVSN